MGVLDRLRGAVSTSLELAARRLAPAAAPAAPAAPITAGYQPETLAAPTPAPSSPRIEIITIPSRLDYAENFAGWKLTPERVAWTLRQADLGEPWQMVDMYEAVLLNDGHTRGLWEQRMDEVAGCPASIRPPPGDSSSASAQAAELLSAAMQNVDLDDLIEHLMLSLGIGYSYAELAWQTRADGLQIPVEIVCVPHRRFRFDHIFSRPHLISEVNAYPGLLLERTAGSSWVRAETKRWRKQTQAGILRTVSFWAVFKRMSVRDWLIFAERFGIPMIIGKVGDNSSETARKALQKTIDILGTDGRAVLDSESTVEIKDQALRNGAGSGEHLHAGITALCNSEISKILTSATLTSDTGGPGSFALGQVHADQKHKLSLADARRVGLAFQKYIGREFLARNGLTDKAQPPWLHIHVQKLSRLTDAQVVKTLSGAGLELSKSQLREQFEYRAPSDEDDTLTPPQGAQSASSADPADPREPADPPDA